MKVLIRRLITAVTLTVVLALFAGRMYEFWTDGFSVAQIVSEPKGSGIASKPQVDLTQEFHYLGKGCQSYAFLSDDGELVIKFVKYKHFRVPSWVRAFSFIPSVENYIQRKEKQKQKGLNQLFKCWRNAGEHLGEQTGIVYLHVDPDAHLNQVIRLRDKMGRLHEVSTDRLDFLVQRRAAMLAPALKQADIEEGKKLISNLFDMLVREYELGYGDLDHALLQNTGVIAGQPVHIDVGQIVYRNAFKNPSVYHQELYNKTYTFRIWLRGVNPALADHADAELKERLGDRFAFMKHSLRHVR